MNRRTGTSLVEVVVCITVGSSLMLLSVTLVERSLRLSQTMQAASERNRATLNFCAQFRRDVRSAPQIERWSSDELSLGAPGRQIPDAIRYRIDEGTIERTAIRDDGTTRREVLKLGPDRHCELGVEEQPTLVVLSIYRRVPNGPDQRMLERFVATNLGRWPPAVTIPGDQQ